MNGNQTHHALMGQLDDFLAQGEIVIDRSVKPAWLINGIDEPIWLIKDGADTRLVDGVWKGAIRINWQMRLIGGGNLTDPEFTLLLQHLQTLAIAHLECPDAGSSTTKTLEDFTALLKGLAEWLVNGRRGEVVQFGLKVLDYAAIEAFLIDCRRFGIGPGIWMQKFDAFLATQFADDKERARVTAWEATQDATLLTEIDGRVIGAGTKSQSSRELCCFTLDESILRWSKRWLAMQGWYDAFGLLSLQKVSDAINVDMGRMSSHAQTRFYLRQFENLADYRRFDFQDIREKIGHRQDTVAGIYQNPISENFLRVTNDRIGQLIRYLPYCDDLKDDHGLADINLSKLPRELTGSMGNRTPSIPVDIALYIYDKAIHWALHHTGPLTDYYIQLLKWVIKNSGRSSKRSAGIAAMFESRDIEAPTDWWEQAFLAVPVPAELAALNLTRFYGWPEHGLPRDPDGSYPLARMLRKEMTVEQVMQLNFACLSILTAAFTVRRDDEIYSMTRNCLSYAPGYGAYVDFSLCKVQIDNVRLQQRRPIPTMLYNALQHQRRLAEALSEARSLKDSHLDKLLFVYPARRNVFTEPDSRTRRKVLDMFCDYIEVPCDEEDRRWYVRLHECRRFFALAFFWMFEDKSLEALSWFMGHASPEDTWRYIKETLSGSEVTQIQAARTVSYIRQENTNAADKLREFALRHFHVTDLNMVSDSSLEAYLEYLIDEGCYTIEPRSLQTGNGAYEMVVSIYKEPDDGAIEAR